MASPGHVTRDSQGRRVAERDRHGGLLATLAWAPDGALAEARVRLPGDAWLRVEPRAARDPRWGLSDRLWLEDVPLTLFSALDWARLDRIPALAEPARLPPGGGTAVLNLIAQLAQDQGAARLAYDGPYPTEQLFLALLESFRYTPEATDALAAFMAGGLAWRPAPHARSFAGGVCVQTRHRVEKVVVRGRAYYRPEWQGVRRVAPRRVRDVGGEVRASLWALDTPIEDHVVLGPGGEVLALLDPVPDPEAAPVPLAPTLVEGLVAAVVAVSAPPLGPAIREAAAACTLVWGPTCGDLVTPHGTRVTLTPRLLRTLGGRLAAAPAGAEAAGVALAALVELAGLVGDILRPLAQARLAEAPADVQAAALRRERPATTAADARAIATAVGVLREAAQPLA